MSGIDNRKDVLLLLLYLPGAKGEIGEPISGRTRLMKIMYLLEKEQIIKKDLGISKGYSFEAYHYGPFSKQVYEDVDFLRNVELIESSSGGDLSEVEQVEEGRIIEELTLGEEGYEYDTVFTEEVFQLTDRGQQFVENNLLQSLKPDAKDRIIEMKKDLGSLSLSSLLKYVYSKFPADAEKSLLKQYFLP